MPQQERAPYSPDDADTDAAHLATLLDIAVGEGCEMDHTGLTDQQRGSMDRIHALLWVCRENAERLRAGVFAAMKAKEGRS